MNNIYVKEDHWSGVFLLIFSKYQYRSISGEQYKFNEGRLNTKKVDVSRAYYGSIVSLIH